MKKKYTFIIVVSVVVLFGALALRSVFKHTEKNPKESSTKEARPVLLYEDSARNFEYIYLNPINSEHVYLDPNNANVLYLFRPSGSGKFYKGEIYKSTDGGKNFKKLSVNGSAVAVSPKHPEVVFVGGNSGLFKSNDYGKSWIKTALNDVRDVKFSTGGILYVIADKGLFVSYDEGEHFNNVGSNKDVHQWNIFPESSKGNVVYESAQLMHPKPEMKMGNIFLKSMDYGKTWKEIDRGLNYHLVTAFADNPDDESMLFAGASIVTGGPGAPITSKTETGIFKSTDGGSSWKKVLPLELVNAIIVNLDNTNTIYVGAFRGLFRSTDCGNTWSKVELGGSSKTVVDDVKQSPISHDIYILQNGKLYVIRKER